MATRVRPARADDVAFLAWVALAASRSHVPRGAWDLFIDGPDAVCLDFLERVLRDDAATFCHWSAFRIAEVDGERAAALSAYDPARVASFDPVAEGALEAMGWRPEEVAVGNDRLAPFLTCVPDQDPETWIVEWVATRPAYRRRGLVDALLADVLALGRERGYRLSQIAVLIGNTPAQAAYEKAGFRLDRERRDPAFAAAVDCPGIAQLRRPL